MRVTVFEQINQRTKLRIAAYIPRARTLKNIQQRLRVSPQIIFELLDKSDGRIHLKRLS
jgi:hypothetical protein